MITAGISLVVILILVLILRPRVCWGVVILHIPFVPGSLSAMPRLMFISHRRLKGPRWHYLAGIAHELRHQYQIRRDGWIFFLRNWITDGQYRGLIETACFKEAEYWHLKYQPKVFPFKETYREWAVRSVLRFYPDVFPGSWDDESLPDFNTLLTHIDITEPKTQPIVLMWGIKKGWNDAV